MLTPRVYPENTAGDGRREREQRHRRRYAELDSLVWFGWLMALVNGENAFALALVESDFASYIREGDSAETEGNIPWRFDGC